MSLKSEPKKIIAANSPIQAPWIRNSLVMECRRLIYLSPYSPSKETVIYLHQVYWVYPILTSIWYCCSRWLEGGLSIPDEALQALGLSSGGNYDGLEPTNRVGTFRGGEGRLFPDPQTPSALFHVQKPNCDFLHKMSEVNDWRNVMSASMTYLRKHNSLILAKCLHLLHWNFAT